MPSLDILPVSINHSVFSTQQGVLRERIRPNLLGVHNDLEAVHAWLQNCHNSGTRRVYAREIERLLLWSYRIANKPLSSLMRQDYLHYEQFLQNPQPLTDWCGPKAKRGSQQWRPLVAPMKPATAKQSLVIIQAMLKYFVDMGYFSATPLARRHRIVAKRTEKIALTQTEWQAVWNTIEALPHNTCRERHRREKLKWALLLFTYTGLRIAEVAQHTMADFRSVIINNKRQWFLYITGKGQQEAEIPINQVLLHGLKQFRQAMHWSDLPKPNDSVETARPLLPSSTGVAIGTRAIYNLLTKIFAETADILDETDCSAASRLRAAGPHTLRHTAITWMGNCADIRIQQRFARHADIRTTINYYDHRETHALIDALESMPNATNQDNGQNTDTL